jgi:hypothetical protein
MAILENTPAAHLIQSKIAPIQWFHRIDLGHGVVTPGDDNSPRKLVELRFPEDLKGKSI